MLSVKLYYWRLLDKLKDQRFVIRKRFRKAPHFFLETSIAEKILQFSRHENFITDTLNGRRFSYLPNTLGGSTLFFEGQLDQATLNYALDRLRTKCGGVVTDLGADAGWHSIYLASRLPACHIQVVEPSKEVSRLLSDNIAAAELKNISLISDTASDVVASSRNAPQGSMSHGRRALVRIDPKALGWAEINGLIDSFLPERPDFLLKFTHDHKAIPEVANKLRNQGYRTYRLDKAQPPAPHTLSNFPAGEYLCTIDAIITPEDLLLTFARYPVAREIHSAIVIGAHRFDEQALFNYALPNLRYLYLFEPIPELVAHLRTLAATDTRVGVFGVAISDQDGVATFHVTTNDGMSSSLLEMGLHKNHFPDVSVSQATTVQTMRLESALAQFRIPPPDLIFLDVQGAEYLILSSIPQDLLASIKVIYTEASKEEIYQGSKPLSQLETLLSPHFRLEEFYPINSMLSTHGNALFLNTSLTRNQDARE